MADLDRCEPEVVLECALLTEFEDVIVVGKDTNGNIYFASSDGRLEKVTYDLEDLVDKIRSGAFVGY